MADPLAVAGSIVGIVSLGIQATQILIDFYSAYKSQENDVKSTLSKLESLSDVLGTLQSQLSAQHEEATLLKSIEGYIQNCKIEVDELQEEAGKLKGSTGAGGFRVATRTAARRVTHPFRQSTLQKLEEDIDEIVSQLSLALQVLVHKDSKRVQDEIEDTKALLDLVRADQISSSIRAWLQAPDATDNYHQACEKRHSGTGLWVRKVGSLLNRHTTRLSASQVRPTDRHCILFFTFNDQTKQDASSMLRALVLQLSGQLDGSHEYLKRLYDSYRNGAPPKQALQDYLRQILKNFEDVYIFLDALDESPRQTYRGDVLQLVSDLRAWGEPGLHLLVTSRDETDIREDLDAQQDETVSLRNESVNQDIADFISKKLKKDRRLRKWEQHHDQIEKRLTEDAKGVFRWVECQFIALASCPMSKRRLDSLLASLPRSLDQTYERILLSIDEESVDDARRILTLLCCATRPMNVSEVIEGVAVELGDDPRFNPDGRLADEDELRRICPGLIEFDVVSSDEIYTSDHYAPSAGFASVTSEKLVVHVRIAHFSVQEYLQSERNAVARFWVRGPEAHSEVASICLSYLLEPDIAVARDETQYPLTRYAATAWHKHYHLGDKSSHQVDAQLWRLFGECEREFECWTGFSRPRKYSSKPEISISRILHASDLNLDSVLPALLRETPSDFSETQWYEEAIETSASKGFTTIVRLLLDKNASTKGRGCGKALVAAAGYGHQAIVKLLLQRGAEIDSIPPSYNGIHIGSALEMASAEGHEAVVRILLDWGANVKEALPAASLNGHEGIVRLLLNHSADPNAGGFETPLYLASSYGNEAVVRLLLDHGADPNAEGRRSETPLYAASHAGHEAVVQLLLSNGAYVNTKGGLGTALDVALLQEDNEAVVRLLRDYEADTAAPREDDGNAQE